MAVHQIIYLPDPRLREMSKPITVFDAKLHQLIDDMFETMYSVRGVGLAAPQIGINIRLAVIDVTHTKENMLVLINPEIIASEGESVYQEGCLSVPGAYDKVTRATKVTLRAQDRNGAFYEITADDLLGECIQHEIDHLNGKLFIDLLSPLKRNLARKKMDKTLRNKKSK